MARVSWSELIRYLTTLSSDVVDKGIVVNVGGQYITGTILALNISGGTNSATYQVQFQFSSPGGTLNEIRLTLTLQPRGTNLAILLSFVSAENQTLPQGTVTLTKTFVVQFADYATEQ